VTTADDRDAIAARILGALGGSDNIVDLTHCMTRLRVTPRDHTMVNMSALRASPRVRAAVPVAGVLHVVVGVGAVEELHDALARAVAASAPPPAVVPSSDDAIRGGARLFSGVFVPILPAIVVAGLLMGVNNMLTAPGLFGGDRSVIEIFPRLVGLWGMINMCSNTAFMFLPALVGWSAARRFGGSEVLGIVLGLFLVHPDLVNAWTRSAGDAGEVPTLDILGLFQIERIGYQAQVLPILIATWILCRVEAWTRARVPADARLLVVPITALVVAGFLALIVIGPATRWVGTGFAWGVVAMFSAVPAVGAVLFGLCYAPVVVTGAHHVLIAVDLQLIAERGGTFIWPMIALSNIAQGSAAATVAWMTKNREERGVAGAAAVSAFFGITEPAMFGVNLRRKYPFRAALIGSAAAAAVISLGGVTASGIGVGGLPAFVSILPRHIPMFLLGTATALIVPALSTLAFARAERRGKGSRPVDDEA